MKAPTLGIFIPAYNAGSTLGSVLQRIPSELWASIQIVIVIDDGSRDSTVLVTREFSLNEPKILLHSFEKNRGYGAAVRYGLKACREGGCDIAVCLHSDGQYPPERIAEFADQMRRNDVDILQGSRHLDGRARAGGMPLYKIVAGKALTRLENICLGHRLTDPHSGFLLYSRRALENIPFDRLSGYFDFDLEAIASALALGLRVEELAIPAHYAGEQSYLNPLRYGLHALRVAARYRSGYYRRLASIQEPINV